MKQPTCNKELLAEVSYEVEENIATVRDVIHEYSKFIADMIREGAFETMLVPYFGKFEPKIKQIQRRYHRRGRQQKHYERNRRILHTDTGLQGGAEQALAGIDSGV